MICQKCQGIPLDLFSGDRLIQYELHKDFFDFSISAGSGCHSCQILLQQVESHKSQYDFIGPRNNLYWRENSYWIEWDNMEDELVIASGWEHYPLRYDTETSSKTIGITPDLTQASSPESLQIIRNWLEKCLKEHKKCRTGDRTLPTRLLDVGSNGSRHARIVYGSQLVDQKATYLALSYCWGHMTKQSPWVLKTTNIENRKKEIPVDQLPQSFLDIIRLTKGLKERYVWIDALCILQDSEEDWEREAATMKHIYANAICTIVSPAPDPTQPLFVERDPLVTRPARLQLHSADKRRSAAVRFHPVLPKWYVNTEVGFQGTGYSDLQASQPTSKRAWCLQEYELSCRVLTFTTHQFVWVCKEMQCSEEEFSATFPTTTATAHSDNEAEHRSWINCVKTWLWSPLARALRATRSSPLCSNHGWGEQSPLQIDRFNRNFAHPPGNYRKWERLVEEYTSRSLTKPRDRLSAIAGLAEKAYQETKDQYLMGLWLSNLKNELLWCTNNPVKSSRIPELSELPTWSWVAVDSPVHFPRRPYALNMFESRMASPIGDEILIEKVKINTAGGNIFAIPRSVRITVEGRLIQTFVQKPQNITGGGLFGNSWVLQGKGSSDVGYIFPDDRALMLEGKIVNCLWMDAGIAEDVDLCPEPERYSGGFGIALLYQTNTEDMATYTRVGFVRFHGHILKQIHKIETSRFSIV